MVNSRKLAHLQEVLTRMPTLLAYADVCRRMPTTYADVCRRMLQSLLRLRNWRTKMLTYADVC
jgi:hypothetical protein